MPVHAAAGNDLTWCSVGARWSEAGGGIAHVALWTLQWHRLSPRRSAVSATLFYVFIEVVVVVFSAACSCDKQRLMRV